MPQFHVSAWASVVLVVSIGLAAGWLLLLWLVSMPGRERHLRAQAATSDLGLEPPAVAAIRSGRADPARPARRLRPPDARAGHGRRLGPGVMLTGNVLVIAQHGLSVAVQLTGTPPQAAGPVLQHFAPVLASRVAAGAGAGASQAVR